MVERALQYQPEGQTGEDLPSGGNDAPFDLTANLQGTPRAPAPENLIQQVEKQVENNVPVVLIFVVFFLTLIGGAYLYYKKRNQEAVKQISVGYDASVSQSQGSQPPVPVNGQRSYRDFA